MHATAVFDGERWGTVLYLFLFLLVVSAFYGWLGGRCSLFLLVTTMMISFVA